MTETTTERLSKEQKDKIMKAVEIIMREFYWHLTSSGRNYWFVVCNKLRDLAKQKETKKCPNCNGTGVLK